MNIADHPAAWLDITAGLQRVRLCAVPDLEALVDREAVLRGEADPPYWAHIWSGSRVLAAYLGRWLDLRGRSVLEIGCGLGLPGMTAAVMGAETTFVDAVPAALAFVAASAAANAVRCTRLVADFAQLDAGLQFDLLLAAEIAYDRSRYDDLAAVCERHMSVGGMGLLADGYRTDTRGLYSALASRGLDTHAVDLRILEEGSAIPVRVTMISRSADRGIRRNTLRQLA